ncbi:ADP-ribose pyrophosphatase YjhB (NUDIX family) [Kribbella amoyensis]|uniref:ADP-ribose pyrophosphatase YjhB (NUDIX family) n=1 Tax=Kribbella amoyensis TaxID=996641 RepID=A0A561BLG1_9ACTN|nr:NUDIX hydrolase [Kribbella amoyensis]TWD79668.1 ADP-ribose pyrophosphatase YjhB (NUDIX family) [Kribbella amoyensis]
MSAQPLTLPQRLTAFTCTTDPAGRILLIRHERLGLTRWELPGGHIEPGESTVQAAIRETQEETGLHVVPGRLLAECRHQWDGRTVGILYFQATHPGIQQAEATESGIEAVDWIDPRTLDPAETSPLAWPVIDHVAHGRSGKLYFNATHHKTSAGWEPQVIGTWRTLKSCT